MKKIIISAFVFILLIVFVFAGYAFFVSNSNYAYPEKTLAFAVSSLEKNDANGFLSCFTDESKTIITDASTNGEIPSGLKSNFLEYKNLKMEAVQKTNDAVIFSSKNPVKTVAFKKISSNWKIDLPATYDAMNTPPAGTK